MLKKCKKIFVFTTLAGSLALSGPLAMAGSQSPFGAANPIQSLAQQVQSLTDQLNALDTRVRNLESPPIPTSLSGTYSVITTAFCLDTEGVLFDASNNYWKVWDTPDNHTWQAYGTTRIRYFTTVTKERYEPDGTVTNLGDGSTYMILGKKAPSPDGSNITPPQPPTVTLLSDTCGSTYTMSSAGDGTFTKTTTTTNACSAGPWAGTFTLQGRAFNGGKTLRLVSTSPDFEYRTAGDNRQDLRSPRLCVRTQTAWKISD